MTAIPQELVELLPCPFCAGKGLPREWDWPYARFQVQCTICKANCRNRLNTREKAIAAWNARPTAQSPEQWRDELAEVTEVAKGCAKREQQYFADRKALIAALKRVKIMAGGVVDERFSEPSQCTRVRRIIEYIDKALPPPPAGEE